MLLKIITSLLVISLVLIYIFGFEKVVMGVYNNYKGILALLLAIALGAFLIDTGFAKNLVISVVSCLACIFISLYIFIVAYSGKLPWFK
ncbi:hypothetical protein BST79_gp253 [Only Syngen Nebraska virus 5]|uniref:hypothetical protein n=1 Tax=Only Syngen Nebraska virus 5 TaxID=1917232 RepID=UPI000901F156|nr:hypothetical protein BST79_gp253 [Only Syngen Nebraska virus 5]APC25766.1 hypothetical protein [Only Syngen Nebraska virus 5]